MPGIRLKQHERDVIEQGLRAGHTQKSIAEVLGRDPGTISREIARNHCRADGGFHPWPRTRAGWGGPTGRPRHYRAARAHEEAAERARRPKPSKLDGVLGLVVATLLRADWSPEQISRRLPLLYPDDDDMRVSHELIYRALFVQARGELKRELTAHLRSGRSARKPQATVEKRGRLVGMVPISQRPAEAEDRAVPGHWEGDLVMGGLNQGAVITLVERRFRFLLLAPVASTRAIEIRQELTRLISALPEQLRRSLTWDQGHEMAQHAELTMDTGMQVFFCDPHSPWQRGSNENTNGLLRQYLPKGCDMRGLTQDDCDAIALRLNTRPRKTLEWQTPAEALKRELIATAS